MTKYEKIALFFMAVPFLIDFSWAIINIVVTI